MAQNYEYEDNWNFQIEELSALKAIYQNEMRLIIHKIVV